MLNLVYAPFMFPIYMTGAMYYSYPPGTVSTGEGAYGSCAAGYDGGDGGGGVSLFSRYYMMVRDMR